MTTPAADDDDDAPVDHLGRLLPIAAGRWPGRVAVEDDAGASATYAELDARAGRIADRLAMLGASPGDRVGLLMPKGIDAVAAIHAILRLGAAYVPADASAPIARSAGIFADSGARAVVADPRLADALRAALPGVPLLDLGSIRPDATGRPVAAGPDPGGLAYVLYTSGSTGVPKGVALSHRNAFAFLDWCRPALGLDRLAGGRFASHAPFHFDLSIFDLFAPPLVGGTLILVGEALGRDPARLGAFLSDRGVDAWYSAPSILALLASLGGLDAPGRRSPGLVLFAGEVFPIPHLRRLRALWPGASMWNLYGPTETNVCTAFEIPPEIPDDRASPYPIGPACPPARVRVVDADGRDVPAGSEGELVVAGPGVMVGYLGRPDLTAAATLGGAGGPWYRTGDLVVDDGAGCCTFRGRRDRMVKRRGHRIELGEIESALHRHDDVARAAVVARPSESSGVSIAAYLALHPGRRGSIVAMKRHCAAHLPLSMIPDTIAFLPAIPSTSTDKVDYRALDRLADAVGSAARIDPT